MHMSGTLSTGFCEFERTGRGIPAADLEVDPDVWISKKKSFQKHRSNESFETTLYDPLESGDFIASSKLSGTV